MTRILAFIFCIALTTGCGFTSLGGSGGGKIGKKRAEKVVQRYSAIPMRKHNMQLKVAQGEYDSEGDVQGLTHLNIEYYANDLMDVESARQAVVETTEGILDALNSEPGLRDQILHYPMEPENLTLRITLDHFFGDYFDPIYLGYVAMEDGVISYYTFNKKIKKREPFDRARYLIVESSERALEVADELLGDEDVIPD